MADPTSDGRVVSACLVGLAIALLVVGVVSGTFFRHVVQILPIILAMVVVTQRPQWGAYAAIPVFLFWTFIVVVIWLFLLRLSGIASGHFTVIEIVSTFLMAGFCIAGVLKSISLGRGLRRIGQVLTFVIFAVLQVAAMWVSTVR